MPRGIADERDSADRTFTPTGNKTKMNGFVEISTLLIHSAPKQKYNEWMHLSPFYTRMHGEWLRYAKSTSQFHWRFLLVRDVRGFQVNPLCRYDITRSDRQIGNHVSPRGNETLHPLGVAIGERRQRDLCLKHSYIKTPPVGRRQPMTSLPVRPRYKGRRENTSFTSSSEVCVRSMAHSLGDAVT